MRRAALGFFAAAALLAGCASPDPTYYTLSAVPGSAVPSRGHVIEVRRPGLAGYLDRSDVVLKSAGYRLDVNSQLRWAEPLGDMIGRVLAEDLTERLPESAVFTEAGAISANSDRRLEVDIQRFDPDADGTVVLSAQVALEGERGHTPLVTRHIVLRATPSGPGASQLAAAMSALLGQLADQIAADVVRSGSAAF